MNMTALMTDAGEARPVRTGLIVNLCVLAAVALCLLLQKELVWLARYPASLLLPVADWVNAVSDPISATLQPASRAFSWMLGVPMAWLRSALTWLPWPAIMLIICAIAWRASGRNLALFSFAVCIYVLFTGYWQATMNTLVLVSIAVPLSIGLGFLVGVWAFFVPRVRGAIDTALDVMQTMPAFAYLIPLLVLFGFGPVVGLIASVIFATPPMVRNTLLGLRQVPIVIKESSLMSGCTPWQQFWYAEIPAAKSQLLVGVNQTTMAALSMVIIGAIVGGSSDLGWEVLSAVRLADLGRSILAGSVIALVAILMDRITLGFVNRQKILAPRAGTSRRFLALLAGILVAGICLRLVANDISWLTSFPQILSNKIMDDLLLAFIASYSDAIEFFKNAVLSFVLLPMRIGLVSAISPFTWGVELTPAGIAAYVAIIALGALGAFRFAGWRGGLTIIWIGLFLYFGVTTMPWTAMTLFLLYVSWALAGPRYAVLTAAVITFALVTNLWLPMVQSFYLCILAVVLCLIIGGGLGVWAAHSDRVSRTLRPICDTLQTMPQFVFLIPALMFFKVGDLTALIAVMLYAIVPPIRYVEHAIRNVDPQVLEAATQLGCTPLQLLWSVKLPTALPGIMLGVNQTIMASLSMLAIAALVGTRDLGQQVYIALGKADAGLGLIAGLAIALIAIASDRIIRAWCARRQGARFS